METKNNTENSNKKQRVLKTAFDVVKNWLGLTLGLLFSIVTVIITQINNSLSKATQPSIIVIPWWIWIIVGAFFVLIGIIAIFVIRYSYEHHYIHHNEKTKCDDQLQKLYEICEGIPTELNKVIDKINLKVTQQEDHLSNVNQLMEHALDLEKIYADAISDCLKTNKQIAAIESSAKRNTEIYIMTSSFLFERYDSNMRHAIVANINKGVKYRYIIPIGDENEFEQMVYAILADKDLDPKYRKMKNNDFLTATELPKEYFMLTIAYYEVTDSVSEVIVKLPADTYHEVIEEKPLTYLVPKGTLEVKKAYKYYSEHKIFLDKLRALYNIGKKEANGILQYTTDMLIEKFPNGVEISISPRNTVVIEKKGEDYVTIFTVE